MAIDYSSEISELSSKLASIEAVLNPDGMRKEADDLRERSVDPGLWEDQENAQAVTRRLSYLDAELSRLEGLHGRLDDLSVMFELAEREADEPTKQEALRDLAAIRSQIDQLEIRTLLRGEHGTHRMVRISKYDNQGRRQTSFSGVDVIPVVRQADHIDIPDDEIRVDVYRSSGPGGQGVNTTDSAVRITHRPTGIVVSCQNERSQIQNRASAMAVLQAKLLERKREEQAAKMNELRGEGGRSWGTQIRSYVLHPYQNIKDLRNGYETGNTAAVMDGEIDGFIEAEIRWLRTQGL